MKVKIKESELELQEPHKKVVHEVDKESDFDIRGEQKEND